jgi:hypothetical protein
MCARERVSIPTNLAWGCNSAPRIVDPSAIQNNMYSNEIFSEKAGPGHVYPVSYLPVTGMPAPANSCFSPLKARSCD